MNPDGVNLWIAINALCHSYYVSIFAQTHQGWPYCIGWCHSSLFCHKTTIFLWQHQKFLIFFRNNIRNTSIIASPYPIHHPVASYHSTSPASSPESIYDCSSYVSGYRYKNGSSPWPWRQRIGTWLEPAPRISLQRFHLSSSPYHMGAVSVPKTDIKMR